MIVTMGVRVEVLNTVFMSFAVLHSLFAIVTGHGMLIDPPSRSTAWRFGFATPINYDDNELFCGGFTMQWTVNNGKCGICGDAYNGERRNELPNGKYAKNLVITRKYSRGTIFTATAQLTSNHKGYFVFRICPATTMEAEVTQECLDNHVLEVVNSVYHYVYELPSSRSTNYTVELKLPEDLVCERCVLQWDYIAGNNWGKCNNGSHVVGCGRQETFRNCADIQITAHENDIDGTFPDHTPESSSPASSSTTHQQQSTTTTRVTAANDKTVEPKVSVSPGVTNGFSISSSSETPNQINVTATQSTTRTILSSTATIFSTTSIPCSKTSTELPMTATKKTDKPTWRPNWRNGTTTLHPQYKPKRTNSPNTATYSTPEMSFVSKATPSPNSGNKNCVAIGAFADMPEMVKWCQVMCKTTVCPESHCHCS